MTEKEYRSHPSVSRSELWRLITESPEKFIYNRENPQPPTNALIFGQAFHMAVLQPEIYDDNFAVAPVSDRPGRNFVLKIRARLLSRRNGRELFWQ